MSVVTTAAGQGPLIICLHGIGGSAESFRAQLDGLADRFRIIAWDAPGYGRSPDPDPCPGAEGYVAEIAAMISAEGAGPAILVGMSWGGVLAMETALRRPDLVRGLVLGDSTRGSGQTPAQAEAMRQRPAELRRLGPITYAQARTPRLLSPAAPADLVERAVAASGRVVREAGFACAAEYMAASDLGPQLVEIAAPTLVIYGTDDIITGRPEAEALAAGIAGAVLQEIPGAGHLSNQEMPEVFNAAVAAFSSSLIS